MLVGGVLMLLGLLQRVQTEYVPMMLGNVVLGAAVSGLLLLYARSLGGVPLPAFGWGWSRRDTLFAAATAVITIGLAWATMILLDRTGAHPLTFVAP